MYSRPIVANIDAGGGGEGDPLRDGVREALSHWPSGVAVLAVRDDDEVVALTVSAFSALSMHPPLVLACVGEHAGILPSLEEAGRFTVSLLPETAGALAAAFAQGASPQPPPFAGEGDPVLRGAIATLVCAVDAIHPGGDHRIVVGRVERVELGEDALPLVYHRRQYRKLR